MLIGKNTLDEITGAVNFVKNQVCFVLFCFVLFCCLFVCLFACLTEEKYNNLGECESGDPEEEKISLSGKST